MDHRHKSLVYSEAKESAEERLQQNTPVASVNASEEHAALVKEGIISLKQSDYGQKLAGYGFDASQVLWKCAALPKDPMSGFCGQVHGSEVKIEKNEVRPGMVYAAATLIIVWVAVAISGVSLCTYFNSDHSPQLIERDNLDFLHARSAVGESKPEGNLYPSHWGGSQGEARQVRIPQDRTQIWRVVGIIALGSLLVALPCIAVGLLISEFRHANAETQMDLCECPKRGTLAGDDPFCHAGQGVKEWHYSKYLELRCHCKKAEGDDTPPWSEDKVYRPEGVDLVLDLAAMVSTGDMSRDDFHEQVGDCDITEKKRGELEHLLQLSQVLKHDIKCDEDSEEYDTCFDGELLKDRRMLFRKSALARLAREEVASARNEEERSRCGCARMGNEPIKENVLVEFARERRIPLSGTMMREAAGEYCIEEGHRRGIPMATHFHKLCSPENWGYCCTELGADSDPRKQLAGKLDLVNTRVMQISDMTEEVLQKADQMEEAVLQTAQDNSVKPEAKVLLFKLFIIFYHHAQLFLRRQEYCTMHPEDLAACEDPLTYSSTVQRVHSELMKSGKAMDGLISCMIYGVRSLEEELDSSSYLDQIVGVVSNLVWRAVHELGTGKLIQRAKSLALSLGKTVWKYRFELMLAGVVAAGAQPLMLAITSTGITTGVATSWSLVFDQLLRNIFLYVGCPIIQSPMLMSMVVRWAMANIILHDVFIDLVILPLWTMAKASLGPIGLVADVVNTGVNGIRTMLQKIREKVSSNTNSTNATMEVQKTWLETAREFHQTPAADFLYMALSVWLGWIWRTIATVVCTAAKVAMPVFNGAESVVDAASQGATSYWMKFAGGTSNFFKNMLGDSSSASVTMMQAQNATALASMGDVAPKVLGAAHSMLYTTSMTATTAVNGLLDVTISSLSLITKDTIVGLGLAQLFAWFFKTWWNPEPKRATVHDRTLKMALDSARTQFNSNTCEGKKHGARCLFLSTPHIETVEEQEEVLAGKCCRATCLPEKTPCDVKPQDERLDEAWDPKAVSMDHLKTQSKYLLNFIKMARVSYGPQCEMKSALLQLNTSLRATSAIAS